MRTLRIAVLSLLLLVLTGAAARAVDWYGTPRPAYVEACLDKNTGAIDRYRLCERFFQVSFEKSDFPDAALFLRQRLLDLIPSYESAAWSAFKIYQFMVFGIIFCGFGALVGAPLLGATIGKGLYFSALGAALLAALTAFGFNVQFRTNFSAYRELTTLRDRIDLELVQSAQARRAPDKAFVDTAFDEYGRIVNEHAKAYGASFSAPTTLISLP